MLLQQLILSLPGLNSPPSQPPGVDTPSSAPATLSSAAESIVTISLRNLLILFYHEKTVSIMFKLVELVPVLGSGLNKTVLESSNHDIHVDDVSLHSTN